jgi:hypothetical protein
MGTRPSPFQPDHTGKSRTVPSHPSMENLSDRTRLGEHAQVRRLGNIALDGGKPKAHGFVAPHGGMHSRTRDGSLVTGVTQTTLANAPDASGAAPLDPTIPGKRLTPPAAYPGMRRRVNEVEALPPGVAHARGRGSHDDLHELGVRVLDEARRSR